MAELQGYLELQRRLNAISGVKLGPKVMQKLANQTVADAKLLVPRRTGNLGRSIHVGAVTATAAQVVASANYAAYVEKGTKEHDITPNAKKALAFASQGIINERFGVQKTSSFRLSGTLKAGALRKFGNAAFVVVKKVHHPGTKAHPYMLPGAQAAVKKAGLAETVIVAWNEAA